MKFASFTHAKTKPSISGSQRELWRSVAAINIVLAFAACSTLPDSIVLPTSQNLPTSEKLPTSQKLPTTQKTPGAVMASPDATTDEQLLQQLYTGRFSVSFTKDGEAQREQGGFDWKVSPAQTAGAESAMSLAINSPIGITLATITYNPNSPTAEKASLQAMGQQRTAIDLDTLMQEALGWRLPITALLPWLGDKAPGQTPSTTTESNWNVKVVSRHDNGSVKIISADNTTLKVSARMVFDAYELADAVKTNAKTSAKP